MGGRGSGRLTVVKWVAEPDRELWQRQTGESDPAWRGFMAYRDMGLRRTIVLASTGMGKRPGYEKTMEAWSRKKGWRRRVEAFDRHQDDEIKEAELDAKRQAARDMVKRHLSMSQEIQRLARVEILRWITSLGIDVKEPNLKQKPRLKVDQLQRLMEYAVKLERLNRDKPESITEHRVDNMTEDELEDRIEHLLKASAE